MAGRRLLIDTSIILNHFRAKSEEKTKVEKAIGTFDSCFISTITVFEVEYGAKRAGRSSDLADVLKLVDVLPFGHTEAKHAARIHANLVEKNERIGLRDVFIAGTCKSHNLPLLTQNQKHFNRVKNLQTAEVKKSLESGYPRPKGGALRPINGVATAISIHYQTAPTVLPSFPSLRDR